MKPTGLTVSEPHTTADHLAYQCLVQYLSDQRQKVGLFTDCLIVQNVAVFILFWASGLLTYFQISQSKLLFALLLTTIPLDGFLASQFTSGCCQPLEALPFFLVTCICHCVHLCSYKNTLLQAMCL